MSENEYANAYKDLMIHFRDQMKTLTSRPFPPKSLPREQKRVMVAQQVDDVAKAYANSYSALNALKPPSPYSEIHATTAAFFQISANDNRQWAEAIRHGSRAERSRVFQENTVNEAKALMQIQQALHRAGGVSSKLDAAVKEFQAERK